jgi:hypothetical protein
MSLPDAFMGIFDMKQVKSTRQQAYDLLCGLRSDQTEETWWRIIKLMSHTVSRDSASILMHRHLTHPDCRETESHIVGLIEEGLKNSP